jgi:hypothetical protein
MPQVRRGHEDVSIGWTYHYNNGTLVPDPVPNKYHFYYKPRWVSNTSTTKRIAIRKIKVFPMTFVSRISIGFINNNGNGRTTMDIAYALTCKKNIDDLLSNCCNEGNRSIDIEFSNVGLRLYYKLNRSIVELNSNFPQLLQFSLILMGKDTLKIFNENEDPNNPGN